MNKKTKIIIQIFAALLIGVFIAKAAVITPAFPGRLNWFSEGDTIEEEDWNALEQHLGAKNYCPVDGTATSVYCIAQNRVSTSTFSVLFSNKTTTNLSEGTNLYWTNARFDARLNASSTVSFPAGTTGDYYRGDRTWRTLNTDIDTEFKVQANASTTISFPAGVSTQYYRGDRTWQTLDTLAVSENTNLYWTPARFNTQYEASSTLPQVNYSTAQFWRGDGSWAVPPGSYGDANVTSLLNASTTISFPFGTSAQYTRGDRTLATFNTDVDTEAKALINASTTVSFPAGATTDYYRGDRTWRAFNTDADAEFKIVANASSTISFPAGATTDYYRGDRTWRALNTDVDAEFNLLANASTTLSFPAGVSTQYYRGDRTWSTFSTDVNSAVSASSGIPHAAPTANSVFLGNEGSTAWSATSVPSCSDGTTSKLLFNSTTHEFSCGTDQSTAGGSSPTSWKFYSTTLITPTSTQGIYVSASSYISELNAGSVSSTGLLSQILNFKSGAMLFFNSIGQLVYDTYQSFKGILTFLTSGSGVKTGDLDMNYQSQVYRLPTARDQYSGLVVTGTVGFTMATSTVAFLNTYDDKWYPVSSTIASTTQGMIGLITASSNIASVASFLYNGYIWCSQCTYLDSTSSVRTLYNSPKVYANYDGAGTTTTPVQIPDQTTGNFVIPVAEIVKYPAGTAQGAILKVPAHIIIQR